MNKGLVLCLLARLAYADPSPAPADAPLADVSGTSVHVVTGQVVPFTGYLVSDDETLRRGKSKVDCSGTLADAQTNGVLVPKAVLGTVIGVAATAVVASIATGIALAAKK